MEASLDRPIAGNINFCPLGVTGNAADFILELAKHETAHALAFASSLFAFWRDDNGNPRTPRNSNGLPMNFNVAERYYMPSPSTIQFDVTYPDWDTINGVINHSVIHMVTPAVLREARAHFNCSSLAGMELENQGAAGTIVSHWEKRIMGNEAMTGELTFNPVFSRISLAAFEDSGWYDVNYTMAQDLLWGKGSGCDFPTRSCLSWINSQTDQGLPVTPYCTDMQRGCTIDYEAVGKCNLIRNNPSLDYQYFTVRTDGGNVVIADYCPFQNVLTIQESGRDRGTQCNVATNQPTVNVLAEVYEQGSRCIEHGTREWTNNRYTGFSTGSGCYQYSCSATTGVTIKVSGLAYQCSCEGEQIQFSFTDSTGASITASLRCPACSQLCHDNLANCPTTEPASCYDRIRNVEGSTDLPVTPSIPDNRAEVTGAVAVTIFSLAALVVATVF
ncbi:leishmanolysin-like peptidase [Halichondria panicea]|uniref:leishmanolysin-like peptidase n=1 Tax=Halichondria panicea TaxID=6063 RepID=UPI00312BB809